MAIPAKKLLENKYESNEIVVDNAHVRNSSKLLQQVSWKEGYDRVLRGDNLVGWINMFLQDAALGIVVVLRQVLVHEHRTSRARFLLLHEEVFDVEVSELVVIPGEPALLLSLERCHGSKQRRLARGCGNVVELNGSAPVGVVVVAVDVVERGGQREMEERWKEGGNGVADSGEWETAAAFTSSPGEAGMTKHRPLPFVYSAPPAANNDSLTLSLVSFSAMLLARRCSPSSII